ncbi:MAG TPA: ABC transporter permease [Candidatus Methylomirabilis sp.]|jgi:ABC-2 type transport system permease protein|nr:ABC transporter permease [Candidatus Methylomirabilis sp.]
MPNLLRGFGAVLYKESLHVRRDTTALLFALIMPILQMVILGFAIDTNVRQIKTVVYDENGGREARELVDRLRNSDTFRVVGYVSSDRELNEAIVGGRAKVGVKIPVDYSARLLDRETAQVLVLIDGSDSSVAAQALNVSGAIGLDESLRRLLLPRQALPVEVRPKLLFNPDSRSPNFFLPGLMAVLLLFVTTFLTAFSIVREKERGTLEQLFVTPVRPLGLLLGKIAPYFAIGFLELCAILFFMRTVFQVPIHGDVFLLLALSLPYLFVALSLGMLISTKAHSQAEAMQLALMTMLPSIFFSGYIFPRETMPLPFYLLSFGVPATYFVNITRGIILRGAGLVHLWADALVLVGMGLMLLLVAAKRFEKKIIAA